MSFSRESRRPDIGNPDLHRPQALSAQTLPMVGDPLTNFAFSHMAMLHVTERSRDLGSANLTHRYIGKRPKAAGQDCHRDALEAVQVHDQGASKPRDRCVARQHNDWAPADLGQLAPPNLSTSRQSTHEPPAARRPVALAPHSSV